MDPWTTLTVVVTARFLTFVGWARLQVDHVMKADTGADLDFLVGRPGSEVGRESD